MFLKITENTVSQYDEPPYPFDPFWFLTFTLRLATPYSWRHDFSASEIAFQTQTDTVFSYTHEDSSSSSTYFGGDTAFFKLTGEGFAYPDPDRAPASGTLTGFSMFSTDSSRYFELSNDSTFEITLSDIAWEIGTLPTYDVETGSTLETNPEWGAILSQQDIRIDLSDASSGFWMWKWGEWENISALITSAITILGSDQADDLIGGTSQNWFLGEGGNDTLTGRDGEDRFSGGDGDDHLYGNDGADDLQGNAGDDSLSGASGQDVLRGGEGHDTLTGGEDADRLDGGTGEDLLLAGSGADRAFGGIGYDTIWGGDGADTLIGDRGYDLIGGGAGHDSVTGGLGHDTLWGGAGDDSLYGGESYDVLGGGTGNDVIDGGVGHDTLFGGAGEDRLDGANGDDLLYGSDGADLLIGNVGQDTLYGGRGNDTLAGNVEYSRQGDGDADVFVFMPGFGEDTIIAFQSVSEDRLHLDDAIWSDTAGTLTVAEVVSAYGRSENWYSVLDFGAQGVITLWHVTSLEDLSMTIEII